MGKAMEQQRLPLIPLRNTVLYPVLTVPLSVGRPSSLAALKAAMAGDRLLVVAAQRDAETDEPGLGDLYEHGVICRILKTIQTAEGHQSVIVQGVDRCQLWDLSEHEGVQTAAVVALKSTVDDDVATRASMLAVKELAYKAIELNQAIPDEAHAFIEQLDDPSVLADVIASNMSIEVAKKQELLATLSVSVRLRQVGDAA